MAASAARKAILCCVTAVTIAGCGTLGRDSLVHMEVHDAPAENGKRLNMRFDEVERTSDASIVQITFDSGGSVSSSMFIMRGTCMVLADRHEAFVVAKPLDAQGSRYRLTFPERAEDVPQIKLPHRDGKPDRTMPDAISAECADCCACCCDGCRCEGDDEASAAIIAGCTIVRPSSTPKGPSP